MRPICATHSVEMKPAQNGRFVLLKDGDGEPYQIWSGDRYDCPVDGSSVVTGFGQQPVAEHFEASFGAWLSRVETVVS